jgi:four helix bundle protein
VAELLTRTKDFSLAIIRFCSQLPRGYVAQILARQLLRSGTSVGAQYREARRAKPTADFISQVEGALQELDEAAYWLKLIGDSGIGVANTALRTETEELLSIFVTIIKTAKENAGRKLGRKTPTMNRT